MTEPPLCFRCGRRPDQIPEYVEFAEMERLDPDQFVRELEGTYNRSNGHFACTDCYVEIGMPSSREGWIAP